MRRRRNSILTDVRLAKNMWTHTEEIGYTKENTSNAPFNRVTWGFTYMNRRHFVEFVQKGKFGEIHSISVDERMIEKVEVDQQLGFGPANYRIWLTGAASALDYTQQTHLDVYSCTNSPFLTPNQNSLHSPSNLQKSPNRSPRTYNNNTKLGSDVRFACVITLTVNKFGQTHFGFTIDCMSFEQARSNWILDYLRICSPDVCHWERVKETINIKNKSKSDEERHMIWSFPYKGRFHEIAFHHRPYNCQWDVTVDSKQVELYKMTENVLIPEPSIGTTQPGRSPPIQFLVAGLPCSVTISKKDYDYFYELRIDGTPFHVYKELMSFLKDENEGKESENGLENGRKNGKRMEKENLEMKNGNDSAFDEKKGFGTTYSSVVSSGDKHFDQEKETDSMKDEVFETSKIYEFFSPEPNLYNSAHSFAII